MRTCEKGPLLEVLYCLYENSSKKKVKAYLKRGCVYVNGQQITQYNFMVPKGSFIEIRKENKTHQYSPLPILYEDDSFLVIDKPKGLLSIGTEKEKEKTAYHMMRCFVKERNSYDKLFILHRLDKETSGVLVFVKEESLKHQLQANWDRFVKERSYVAVVVGLAKEREKLNLFLAEGKDLKMHAVDKGKGKRCVTKYQCLKKGKMRSLLQISIETGRKNQIRASLSSIGLPVLGDQKYGEQTPAKRLYLHADRLVLEHPITHKQYQFTAKVPSCFKKAVQ